MTKVIISTGIFPPDIGGPATFVPLIAEFLRRSGFDVSVVCYSEHLYNSNNFEFDVIRVSRSYNFLFRKILFAIRIRQLITNDCVIFSNSVDVESWLGSAFSGVAVISKFVGNVVWESFRNKKVFNENLEEFVKSRKLSIPKRLYRSLYHFILSKMRKIFVPSEYLKNHLIDIGVSKHNVCTIYNSVKSSKLNEYNIINLSSKDKFTLITVCRLVSWKGLPDLIMCVKNNSHLCLKIVGTGPEKNKLMQLAADFGIQDRVVFVGQLISSEVQKELQKSDLFILNSEYEGLPHVVLEAMAAGIPVVASKVGGTPELVIDRYNGLLVESGNISSLDTAIQECYSSVDLRKLLVSNAFETLRTKFTQEAMLKQYFEEIEKYISRAKQS